LIGNVPGWVARSDDRPDFFLAEFLPFFFSVLFIYLFFSLDSPFSAELSSSFPLHLYARVTSFLRLDVPARHRSRRPASCSAFLSRSHFSSFLTSGVFCRLAPFFPFFPSRAVNSGIKLLFHLFVTRPPSLMGPGNHVFSPQAPCRNRPAKLNFSFASLSFTVFGWVVVSSHSRRPSGVSRSALSESRSKTLI